MSEIVEFKPVSPASVTLEDPAPATRLEVPLGARSIVGRDMFVRVSVSAQDKSQAGWFTLPPALGRIELKAGQELAIPVTVEIPAETPFDKHGFKVLVADDAAPENDFSLSPLVTVERRQKVVDRSWWRWVALGAGVAGAVAVAVMLVLFRGTPLGEACDPSDPDCRGGVCPPELGRCVAPRGVACEGDGQCLSSRCADGRCAPALLGDACYPSNNACEGDRIGCLNQAPHRCVSFQGGPCRTPADCVDGACTEIGGALTCGEPIGQRGCTSDAQCPANQVCVAAASGKICLYRGGVLCPKLVGHAKGGHFACASQICNIRGRCAPHDKSCVPEDQDCGSNEACVRNRCQAVGGGTLLRPVINFAAPPVVEQIQEVNMHLLRRSESAAKRSGKSKIKAP